MPWLPYDSLALPPAIGITVVFNCIVVWQCSKVAFFGTALRDWAWEAKFLLLSRPVYGSSLRDMLCRVPQKYTLSLPLLNFFMKLLSEILSQLLYTSLLQADQVMPQDSFLVSGDWECLNWENQIIDTLNFLWYWGVLVNQKDCGCMTQVLALSGTCLLIVFLIGLAPSIF